MLCLSWNLPDLAVQRDTIVVIWLGSFRTSRKKHRQIVRRDSPNWCDSSSLAFSMELTLWMDWLRACQLVALSTVLIGQDGCYVGLVNKVRSIVFENMESCSTYGRLPFYLTPHPFVINQQQSFLSRTAVELPNLPFPSANRTILFLQHCAWFFKSNP